MQKRIQHQPAKLTMLRIENVASDTDFQRIDHKEFRYKGFMYDIVREIKTGQTTVFFCLPDNKETSLFARLNRVNQNRPHFVPLDHINMIFCVINDKDFNTWITGHFMFTVIPILVKSCMLPIWSPPPENP